MAVSRLTPQSGERPDGRIEGTAGRARDLDGPLEHSKELAAYRRPRATETPELAVGAVVAHHLIERCDTRERSRRGGPGGVLTRAVQPDPHRHAHVNLGEFVRKLRDGLRKRRIGTDAEPDEREYNQWSNRAQCVQHT